MVEVTNGLVLVLVGVVVAASGAYILIKRTMLSTTMIRMWKVAPRKSQDRTLPLWIGFVGLVFALLGLLVGVVGITEIS